MRKMPRCLTPNRQPHVILDTHNCRTNNFSYIVQRITELEQGTDEVKARCKEFTEHIIKQDGERQIQDWNEFTETDHVEFREVLQSATSDKTIPEEDELLTPDVFGDTYLNKEIAFMRGAGDSSGIHYGKVTKRLRDSEGRPIGTARDNPVMDTSEYMLDSLRGQT